MIRIMARVISSVPSDGLYPVSSSNALLNAFNTPFGTTPFKSIAESDYQEAFDVSIQWARDEVAKIVENEENATFSNTIEALEFSGARLDRISSCFFNLKSAESTDGIQKLAQEISPKLSTLKNDINLNPELFSRIKQVWEDRGNLDLSPEQSMLLEKTYKRFSRNGSDLSPADQEILRELDKDLSKLSLTFSDNVLADENAYEMLLSSEADLDGLPESAKASAKEKAEKKSLDGWLFTLDYPSYLPFMTYATNRDLRQQLSLAMGSVAFSDNDKNNSQIVLDIMKKRHQRAQLLGYNTHAEYVLEERMAETPTVVDEFLEDLRIKAQPAAQRDFNMLKEIAAQDGIAEIEKWDSTYYSEKLKKERFDLDQELLRPYFKLENVLNGAFEVAGKLYGLTFDKTDEIDVYHEDVQTYIVKENGEFKAVFYADFFPRKGKQ